MPAATEPSIFSERDTRAVSMWLTLSSYPPQSSSVPPPSLASAPPSTSGPSDQPDIRNTLLTSTSGSIMAVRLDTLRLPMVSIAMVSVSRTCRPARSWVSAELSCSASRRLSCSSSRSRHCT